VSAIPWPFLSLEHQEASLSDYTVSLIQNDDSEEFMRSIGRVFANGAKKGELPTIAFSHAVFPGGVNYAAILVGPGLDEPSEDSVNINANE
jgi:hypothetical protein